MGTKIEAHSNATIVDVTTKRMIAEEELIQRKCCARRIEIRRFCVKNWSVTYGPLSRCSAASRPRNARPARAGGATGPYTIWQLTIWQTPVLSHTNHPWSNTQVSSNKRLVPATASMQVRQTQPHNRHLRCLLYAHDQLVMTYHYRQLPLRGKEQQPVTCYINFKWLRNLDPWRAPRV